MPPRSEEQFEAIRQQSRKKIMDKALELFARQGYHSTTISQIAKAAGVSKGLMYNYFISKEDLLEKLVEKEIASSEEAIGMEAMRAMPPYQQLVLLIEASIQYVQTDIRHWRLITALSMQEDILQQVKALILQKMDTGVAQLVDLFERLGVPDPKNEAFFFSALLDGMFLHFLTTRQITYDYPLEAMKQKILARYANYKPEQI